MPSAPKRVCVLGMYLRSSLRISSARMKTKLGLVVIACASRDGVPQTPAKSTTDNATEISNRMVLLTSTSTPLTEPDLANYVRGAPVQIIEFARFTHLQIDNTFVP